MSGRKEPTLAPSFSCSSGSPAVIERFGCGFNAAAALSKRYHIYLYEGLCKQVRGFRGRLRGDAAPRPYPERGQPVLASAALPRALYRRTQIKQAVAMANTGCQ